ncbi:MAG: VOC family protein [Aldersonia sp.]|nr:VOC family protein [Aldersonia sp.]
MPIDIAHVTIDCSGDASALAHFYAQLLNQPVDDGGNEFFATVGRSAEAKPVLMFIRVPDKNPGKNVMHLDMVATDWTDEIERAVSLGAERVGDYDEYGAVWTTLRDPEGNLFDIGRAG